MGNRISISFTNELYNKKSVVLFSHSDGEEFLDTVHDYLAILGILINKDSNIKAMPLGRLEPQTVMVDFIKWLTEEYDHVERNYYLGKDENDGDNSDNGHHEIELMDYMPKKRKKDLKDLEDLLKKNRKEIVTVLISTDTILEDLEKTMDDY